MTYIFTSSRLQNNLGRVEVLACIFNSRSHRRVQCHLKRWSITSNFLKFQVKLRREDCDLALFPNLFQWQTKFRPPENCEISFSVSQGCEICSGRLINHEKKSFQTIWKCCVGALSKRVGETCSTRSPLWRNGAWGKDLFSCQLLFNIHLQSSFPNHPSLLIRAEIYELVLGKSLPFPNPTMKGLALRKRCYSLMTL